MSVQSSRTIAVLAANAALGAILGREIEGAGGYRVPVFSQLTALSTFLRIAPVDVAVLSLDLPWAEVMATVRALKHAPGNASPLLEVIVLTHAVPLMGADDRDIASVLRKPASPTEVLKAIEKTLDRSRVAPRQQTPLHVVRTGRRPELQRPSLPAGIGSNVIPLFGRDRPATRSGL